MGTNEAKPIWQSVTFWTNALGIVGTVAADMSGWLENAEPRQLTVVGIGYALAQIIIRLKTKRPVTFTR